MKNSIIYVYLISCLVFCVFTFNWQKNDQDEWAINCDFRGDDYGKAAIKGEDCIRSCHQKLGCTHFTWHGGWCYFKTGQVNKNDAIWKPFSACGVINKTKINCHPECDGCIDDGAMLGLSCLKCRNFYSISINQCVKTCEYNEYIDSETKVSFYRFCPTQVL